MNEKLIAIIGYAIAFFGIIFIYYIMEMKKVERRKWIDEKCIPNFIDQFEYKPVPLEDYERLIFEYYVKNNVTFNNVKSYFDLSDEGIIIVFESIRSKIWNLRYEISQEDIVQDMSILEKVNEINYQAAKILNIDIEDIVTFSHKIIEDGILLHECEPEKLYRISSYDPNEYDLKDNDEWLDDYFKEDEE